MKTRALILTVAMFLAASLQTHAQGFVYDQQSATNAVAVVGNGNADGLDIQPSPLTQSFIPTLSSIYFIQLEFEDVPNNGTSGATVYVNLWTGSPNVNSATFISSTTPVYMPNGFANSGLGSAGITNFYFLTAIALTPGQIYYFQPVVLSGDNPWDIVAIGNTYPNGQLFDSGAGFNSDLYFREGVLAAAPEPTTLALVSLGGLLVFGRKRCHILTVAMFFAASLQTHAQGFVYDQQSATNPLAFNNPSVDFFNIQPDGPLTQSFTPTLSTIGFVQFEFIDPPGNGNNGVTVYVNIWTGSANINSATLIGSTTPVYMPNGFGYGYGVTNFYFSSPIALTPGQTYYLQPVVQSGDNPWEIMVLTNTYSNGQFFAGGGAVQPSSDLWFREGVILATPEPTTLALAGLGGILALALKCRSKLLILFGIGALLLGSIHAQTTSDSVVQVTADIAGLTPVDVADLPSSGTFLILQPGANGQVNSMPMPFLPPNYSSLPIYQVSDNTFLVDDTGGLLVAPSALNRNRAQPAATIQAQVQMQAVASLIEQIQTSNYIDTSTNGDISTNIIVHPNGNWQTLDTNGLWLEIVGYHPSDTNLQLVLHNTSDDQLYQLNSATNLLSTNWDIGDLQWGDWDSDQTWFTPVPMTKPATFYRAHHADAIMQVWDVMDSMEINPTNSNGHIGIIGIQNGVDTPATNDINVYYTVGGTAQNGIDYLNLPGMLTLAAGMSDTNIIINPTAMGLQPDKTIVLTLLQNRNYLIDPDYAYATNILYANPELVLIAYGDTEYPCPNTPWPIYLRANLPLTSYTIVTWPTHGILDTNALPTVTYTPTNCFEGSDSFTFTVNNSFSTSAPATVTLNISDPVFASPVYAVTLPGQPVSFGLSGGDSCGENVNYILPASLPHGWLNTNALLNILPGESPSVTYTLTATNFTGVETFNYIVTSSCGGDIATSSVSIYIPGGPNLMLGCNPFGMGTYVPLEWFLGTNESQMQQKFSIIDYKIYRCAVSGGPYTCIGTNLATSQTSYSYMDTNVVAGQTNYYVVTFEFGNNGSTYESPFSNEIKAVPYAYDLIAPDATWDVWDISTNRPKSWKGYLQAPFSSEYPSQYPDLNPWPNSYWPPATNGVESIRSNNIALILPVNWTNQTQLAQVKYSIAIDNDYWLYLNHSTNYIDAAPSHEGQAAWSAFQSFQTVAPGLLHGGTNYISVVIRDRSYINYFSMVVTTNTCGQ